MNAHDLTLVASGAILFGYLLIGILFLRFWMKTRERLFAFFAAAFWLLALERILLLSGGDEASRHPVIYVTRLIAFLVIIWAIWDKNRQAADR